MGKYKFVLLWFMYCKCKPLSSIGSFRKFQTSGCGLDAGRVSEGGTNTYTRPGIISSDLVKLLSSISRSIFTSYPNIQHSIYNLHLLYIHMDNFIAKYLVFLCNNFKHYFLKLCGECNE